MSYSKIFILSKHFLGLTKRAKTIWYNVCFFDQISDNQGGKWELPQSVLSDPYGKDTSGILPVDVKGDHWQQAVQPIMNLVSPGSNTIVTGKIDPIAEIKPNDILKQVKNSIPVDEKYNKGQQFLLNGEGYWAVAGKPGMQIIVVFQPSLGNEITKEKVKENKIVNNLNIDGFIDSLDAGKEYHVVPNLPPNIEGHFAIYADPDTSSYDLVSEFKDGPRDLHAVEIWNDIPHLKFYFSDILSRSKLKDVLEWLNDHYGPLNFK